MAASPTEQPATIHEAFARGGWHWPEGYQPFRVARCRAPECGALILFAISRLGRTAPFNRDGVSHFATCTQAKRFRGEV